eukprot:CAMPEP_0115327898 /NCGR_PEP_ID=MMETSP0270-20121206/84383_1 /TAXON_ID=71861 /ORGANISM="Scrippsiella trochoidea, Strain CCMP3099" /LENGTH=97 /DNA_ID=CAMNT_0002748365 /DNA_START=172 /DNA_END=461 /DNA_ORIENTATION=-
MHVRTQEIIPQSEKLPLDETSIALRGVKIKNVQWALGVAVYTGKETKIMMNNKGKKGRKMSHLEHEVGKFTGIIMCIQVILCAIVAAASAAFDTSET